METRVIVAYVLCATLILLIVFAVARYRKQRRQFKTRQMGRGKNVRTGLDSTK